MNPLIPPQDQEGSPHINGLETSFDQSDNINVINTNPLHRDVSFSSADGKFINDQGAIHKSHNSAFYKAILM